MYPQYTTRKMQTLNWMNMILEDNSNMLELPMCYIDQQNMGYMCHYRQASSYPQGMLYIPSLLPWKCIQQHSSCKLTRHSDY